MSDEQDISVPSLYSPEDGMRAHSVAVQFCWEGVADGFGYELQYGRKQDFSDALSVVMQNLHPSDRHTHLPETSLTSGLWFWRVRTMTREGIFGAWSPVRSLTTVSHERQVPRELSISAESPLFIFFSDEAIVENWNSLPQNLKPHAVLRVEHYAPAELLRVCELAQEHGIPLLLQVAGPHDVYDGRYAGSVRCSPVQRGRGRCAGLDVGSCVLISIYCQEGACGSFYLYSEHGNNTATDGVCGAKSWETGSLYAVD